MKTMHPLRLAIGLALLCLSFALFAHGMHAEGAAVLLFAEGGASVDLEDLAKEMKSATSKFREEADGLKEMKKEVDGRLEKGETLSRELKEAIDKALTNFNGLKEQLGEVEQKLSQRAAEETTSVKSYGQQFVESEAFKGVDRPGQKRGRIYSHEVKTVTATAAGGLVRKPRQDGLVELPRERRVMRDLLTVIPVQESAIEYAKQTTRTNNAAPVAEGGVKPYSDFAWSSATVNAKVLAHLAKVTRQAMDDAPRLMAEIDSEMRYGLGYVEERQFLYGSGVGENLHGIIPQATAFARVAGVGQQANMTRIDVLRFAMLQAAVGLFPADGIVLNLVDWALIEGTKTTDGAYLFANPQGNVDKRMWGLPVVDTPAMDAGDFLVGAFGPGATVYDRMAVEVLLSTENADDFEKNLATLRAEERVAIAVKRPGCFITGDFTTAIAALQAA